MIDKNLSDYIHFALQQGLAKDKIKQSLVANGWQGDMVEEAFGTISNPSDIGLQPSSSIAQLNLSHKKPAINSPFSVLLAVLLTVTLFIITNKIISDITDFYQFNITTSLIVNGFIVLPFLLLAFALHFTIGEKNEKYLILTRPYYIIAGWLLIRLLYEVSKYILDRDSAYGVYVVLILIIAVLTAMVIFTQKYLKK